MSIICVGDLLQLPPVGQQAVFSDPSDEMASIYVCGKHISRLLN